MIVKLEDHYFSEALKWMIVIGSLLASGYLIYTGHNQWIVFFLLTISLISFSTKYLLEIDTGRKVIIDSFYFLGIKTKSEVMKYQTLKCIRLDKVRHTYNASSRSRDRQADFNEYVATLEYDHNKSLELERKMEYQSLAEQMNTIAGSLGVPIVRTF